MKRTKVLTILFRDFIVYNFIFTLAGGYYLLFYGVMSLPYLFWIKVVGYVLLGFWYYEFRKHRLYFYYNLGLSLKAIAGYSLMIDGLISFIFYLLVYVITGNR